jgi:hypothetical protein
MMWIPSHVGVRGNERADLLAGDAVENGMELHAPARPSDVLPLSRVRVLEGWQNGWDDSDIKDMLTLFGMWFNLCLGLGVLTETESLSP